MCKRKCTPTHKHTGFWLVHSPLSPVSVTFLFQPHCWTSKWQCQNNSLCVRLCVRVVMFFLRKWWPLERELHTHLSDRVWAQQKFRQRTIMWSERVCALCVFESVSCLILDWLLFFYIYTIHCCIGRGLYYMWYGPKINFFERCFIWVCVCACVRWQTSDADDFLFLHSDYLIMLLWLPFFPSSQSLRVNVTVVTHSLFRPHVTYENTKT